MKKNFIQCKRCGDDVEDDYWKKEEHYWTHAETNDSPMGRHVNKATHRKELGLWGDSYDKAAELAEKGLELLHEAMIMHDEIHLKHEKEYREMKAAESKKEK